jgi:ABC-type lipoprotein export system ATPase subunit
MLLQLQNIIIPYIQSIKSDIWNKQVQFEQGNYYLIQAASGKGKSSLIETLYGLKSNFDGNVSFDNFNLKNNSADQWSDLRAKKMSIVFQDLKLFEDQTAFDNIDIKRTLTNFYPLQKIEEFAKRLNVTHTLNRKINTLSFGERQRIAIIRALMQDFVCLLLDEPFSHLDEDNITLATSLILEEVEKRKALLLLTDLENDDRFPYHEKMIL